MQHIKVPEIPLMSEKDSDTMTTGTEEAYVQIGRRGKKINVKVAWNKNGSRYPGKQFKAGNFQGLFQKNKIKA